MLVRAQKNIKDLNEIGIQVNFKIKPIVKYIENNKDEIEFNKLFNVKNLCGVKTFPRPWNEIANNGKILAKFLKKNVFDKINLNEDKILLNNKNEDNNNNKNNLNQITFQTILESTKFLRRMQYTVKVHKKNMKYFFDRRFKIIQRAWRHYFYGVKIPKI